MTEKPQSIDKYTHKAAARPNGACDTLGAENPRLSIQWVTNAMSP